MHDIAHDLSSIRRALRESANAEAAAASRRFVPSAVRVYGVRMPTINGLARQHRSGGFALTKALWRSGAFEERLLAADKRDYIKKALLWLEKDLAKPTRTRSRLAN